MKSNKSRINVRIQNARGITLLALAVTIVVLLILASIGIKLALGDNGIIGEAKNAKELAEIDEEKGIVKRATTVSLIKSKGSKVEQDTLEKALDDEAGEGRTEVSDVGSIFEVLFTDSNRYYEVDEEGNISDANEIVKDDYAGDITKGGRCDGSKEKPYEINCIEDLVVFSNMTNGTGIKLDNGQAVTITKSESFSNKNVILTRNLNFKSKYSYNDYEGIEFGDLNKDGIVENIQIELTKKEDSCVGFTPISVFVGSFNGNNYIINNIYINKENKAGVFEDIRNATICNLKVSGDIIGNNDAGGICATASKSKIINCTNYANIKGRYTGGICGVCNVSNDFAVIIQNCSNYGNIEGSYGTGGILGWSWHSRRNRYI